MSYLDKLREEPYFIRPEHIEIETNKLGGGSFGAVYFGKCRGQQCAVKIIHTWLVQNQSSESLTKPLEQFLQECKFTSQTRNEHIVKFLGTSIHSPSGEVPVPVLITELMECSLTAVLDCKFCALPYHREVNVARDIAFGLDYLHTCSPPIVHRDLSSNNILLAHNYTAKIADLGVAKYLRSTSCTPGPGTTVYMPPEVTRPSKLSVAIDLFSYGVLMVQLETTKFPDPKDEVDEDGEVEEEGGGREEEGGKQGLKASQEDEDEASKMRPEIQRRRNHLDFMEESGVFYRIAIHYLQDKPRIRRQTQLRDVMKWLEEETHSQKYKDSRKDCPETPLEHRLQCHSGRGKPTVAANPEKTHEKKHKTMTLSTQESGYFSQSMQRRKTAPPSAAQVVEHQGGPGLEVAGAGPQGTSGHGMMRAFIDTLSQIPSRLGLATNNEDDKAYQQRVMKSL